MPVKDTTAMIAGMEPVLQDGTWVYCAVPDGADTTAAFAMIREAEGVTLILPIAVARAAGHDVSVPMRRITLNVFSDLEGIGLTAAVATALAGAGISCNVIAAYHHDHVFVGAADAERAVAVLQKLQRTASKP
ncbi:ACT domain-containing protein [uncultured Tateyamaria sp.]|uniref:ACT domain-containing protein n=1 Tax=Tateyamaria sp. 1078 TaxID=3417464 RepID=UPI00263280A2|nr:ACT domain-containing protein [uncultured Tateyamaria sp.]